MWGLGGAAVLVFVLAALVVPAAARADCGGPEIAEPSHHVRGVLPPLVIGDSTMLLALYQLAGEGYDAEAQGCRQFPAALAMLSERKSQGTLPHMVVIALGANGSVTPNDVGVALGLLCCQRLLVLVTPRELGGGSGSDAVVEREQAQRHPGRILLLDWVEYSQGHPEWFQPDGLHLTTAGATAFTRLLARALPYAQPKRKRKPKPKPKPKRGSHHNRERGAPAEGSPPTGPALGQPLVIRASDAHLGYITASISGPLGTRVALSELAGHVTRPIDIVTLASGATTVPRALRWQCDRRVRDLVVSTLAPAVAMQASVSVQTPSCSRRLATRVDRDAAVGGALTIALRDPVGDRRAAGHDLCLGAGGRPRVCALAPADRRTEPSDSHRHPAPRRLARHSPDPIPEEDAGLRVGRAPRGADQPACGRRLRDADPR